MNMGEPNTLILSLLDEEAPRLSQSPVRSTREVCWYSPCTTRRHIQVSVVHNQQVVLIQEDPIWGSDLSKISTDGGISWTIGYVFSVLESLPIESMNTFWWEANKVLMNDEDIRDGLRN